MISGGVSQMDDPHRCKKINASAREDFILPGTCRILPSTCSSPQVEVVIFYSVHNTHTHPSSTHCYVHYKVQYGGIRPPTYLRYFQYLGPKKWFPTPKLAETKMLQHKKNQKVTCNMLQLTFICVSYFGFILLPTGSPLMKLGQF